MTGVISTVRQMWLPAVVLSIFIAVIASVGAYAQSAGVGGRVANPDPSNPRTQSIFIYTLEHGKSKTDQLLVVNQTDQPQDITLGSVDGVVTNSGDYTCRQAAEPVEGSGGWIKLSKERIRIPANSEEKVDFTVTVPTGADVGEHNSCLTIQADADESEATSGVRLRMRQAVRMVVTVPGDLKRELAITEFGVTKTNTSQRFLMVVGNSGNVSADVDMRVRLTSMFGREVAAAGGEYPIVPGESLSKEFVTEYRPLFGGWYEATPSLRYDKRLGAFGTQNTQAEYETQTGEALRVFFWPTSAGWLIIIFTLFAVIMAAWYLRRRSLEQMRIKKSLVNYIVKDGDSLQSLAEKAKTDWKIIAKLNRISAPYTLTPGQEIKIPTANLKNQKKTAAESPKE